MPSIPILGVPSTFRVPGEFAEILFAQGPATAAAAAREVIFVAPKLAASGSWTASTIYRVRNEQEAITGAGSGSPLHRAIRRFLLANKRAKVWALPYLPSSGAGSVAAAGTVTYVGAPSGTGVTTVTVCGEQVSYGFTTADTITSIAAGIAAGINARTWLPVTATPVAGVVTITAKVLGASQGDGTTGVIRCRAVIDSGITTTVATSGAALGLGAGTAGVDGATTETANLTTALAVMEAARYYYVVATVWAAAQLTVLQTHVSGKSEPLPGLRSVCITGNTGALAAAQALAVARNYERLKIAWQPNSEHDTAELAGNLAAIIQKYEEVDAAWNFDGYRAGGDWHIHGAFDQADWPDSTDLNDAITDGLTPIGSDGSGSYVVMMITTRSKDATGAVDDFRACESHRISVMDLFTDTLLLRHRVQYGGKKLKGDELLADGSVNTNQKLYRNVVTPRSYAPFVKKLFAEFEAQGLIQDLASSIDGLQVVRDPNNTGRIEVGGDVRTIDLLHQTTFRLAEVSPG